MIESLGEWIEIAAAHAPVWGFVFIFVFMTIESSFIPFPSEVVMIPAGVLAYRGELTFASPYLDLTCAILIGIAGSLLGAWVNYYLSAKLGRPFLHRYGRYFFISEKSLTRAEEVFREHGDIATFVCRLLPAIRQLISIPAGLSGMNPKRFTFFTTLGAGIWVIILTLVGYYFGHLSDGKSYLDIVRDGKTYISDHYIYVTIGLVVLVGVYCFVHYRVMNGTKSKTEPPNHAA